MRGWGEGLLFAQTLNIFLYIDVCVYIKKMAYLCTGNLQVSVESTGRFAVHEKGRNGDACRSLAPGPGGGVGGGGGGWLGGFLAVRVIGMVPQQAHPADGAPVSLPSEV